MAEVEVQNINGTSKDRYSHSKGSDPWIKYWDKKSEYGLPIFCACEDCYQMAKVGAHVMKTSGSHEWYIVPLCYECNKKEEPFNVDEDLLVELNQ